MHCNFALHNYKAVVREQSCLEQLSLLASYKRIFQQLLSRGGTMH